ncbi:MAG: hypothetical protein MZV65_42240 [Chromatiales bacterium]|nr:hypothetical protein [Chromatiales bacterium]
MTFVIAARRRSPPSRWPAPTRGFRCTASTASGATTPSTRRRWASTGARAAVLLRQARRRVVPVAERQPARCRTRRARPNLHHEIELVVAIGTGGRDIAAADARAARLGLRGRPRHDAPRPAGRGEEAGPAVGHRQGLRAARRRSSAIQPDRATGEHRRAARSGSRSTARRASDGDLSEMIWSVAEIDRATCRRTSSCSPAT